MVIITVLWPLLQLYDTGDNKTGDYASLLAIINKHKVHVRNRTYSAYSRVRIISYADPAPFATPLLVQEGYPIYYG